MSKLIREHLAAMAPLLEECDALWEGENTEEKHDRRMELGAQMAELNHQFCIECDLISPAPPDQ